MKLININKQLKALSTVFIGFITLAASTFACSEPENKILVSSSLGELFNKLVNSDEQTQRTLELNKGLRFNVILEGTAKGNGTLKIHNLNLRMFDQHDDGIVYEGGSLKIDFKDLDGDKINEMIITGVIKYTGDDESEPAKYEPFTQIYTYDCKAGIFNSLYNSGAYSIELPIEGVKAINCVN